ncbi:MAG: T9SS type A sorting domain-containing protein [Crocinitomicaceae bacterium]|nr:T9SS type A sorting domain-containing protein [Crocinitomicaceae bacterium]MDP4868608.1 T9SS type A sorting domain-containing protein [Crocinitomicaceae bacterium]MDP4955210.1 T9SS type A sorting domain-containing protein [Crocinitomicaceae bacterium]
MKKLYVSFLAVMAAGTFHAQVKSVNAPRLDKKTSIEVGSSVAQKPSVQAKATTIWSDDFSTAANWAIASTGSNQEQWNIINTPTSIPVSALSPFASPTAANGFLFVNSDANNSGDMDGTPIITTATTVNAIDCSAHSVVKIKYNHNFRWWHDTRGVRVSGDNGATWTEFLISDEVDYFTPNQNSDNPEVTIIDVSSIAAGSSQVKVQFYYNDNDYWGWYWAVDDVELYVPEANDLKLNGVLWGSTGYWAERLAYYQVPTSQITEIEFSGLVENIGAQNQTGAIFTTTTGAFSSSSTGQAVNVGSIDTLNCTTSLTPPTTIMNHVLSGAVTMDLVDGDATNNTLNNFATIAVNQFVYSRDNGTALNGSFNGGMGFEVGNIFDIFANTTIGGGSVYINGAAEVGAEMYLKLYSIDPASGDFLYVDETGPYVLTANDIDAEVTLSFLGGNYPLNAGEAYLLVAGSNGDGGATNDLVVGTAGPAAVQTCYYYDMTDLTWYYTTSQPMVRMNFDPALGMKETANNFGLEVAPNPATDATNVTFNVKNTSDVIINVIDMAGKVVATQTLSGVNGTQAVEINTSALNSGMYTVNVNANGTAVSKKLAVRK